MSQGREGGEPHAGRRRRWLVLTVAVVLLAAGAVAIARLPRGTPPVAAPSTSTGAPPTLAPTTAPSPTGSPLPTPPTPPPRPADLLGPWATKISAVIGVPVVAVQAYGYAAEALRLSDPSCHLGWTTLAGVAQVESIHGQIDGAVLGQNGRSAPPVLGPPLDGKDGRALVPDTDAGAFDGDPAFDRAMGPLHLLPVRWRAYAVDADADSIADPFDLDDASLALARLLCAGPDDMALRTGWNAALARHRSGKAYADSVFAIADSYGQQTKNVT